jgi:hypothetical protein
MRGQLAIAIGAAFAGWAACALAQSAAPGATLSAVKATAGPARPAESGASNSAATTGPLAIGSIVKDRAGATVGHIVRLTTDKRGVSVAQIRLGEDVFSVPVSELFSRGGEVLSTVSLDDLKQGRTTPSS